MNAIDSVTQALTEQMDLSPQVRQLKMAYKWEPNDMLNEIQLKNQSNVKYF